MSKTTLIAFLTGLLLSTGSYAAETDVQVLKGIVTDVSHRIAPGCAVGVFRKGEPNVITASGYADIGNRRLIDGNTLFYAASVSKQFTALAIAQLVAANKLRLDDHIRNYLPELPRYQVPVTIAMLLHHTSGIKDWLNLMSLAGENAAAPDSRKAALNLLLDQKTTNFTPGTQFLYSNGGYLLLAEIIHRVSGQNFSDYVKDNILDPIGMKDSYVINGKVPLSAHQAHGYVPKGTGFVERDSYPHFGGSGGLMVTMNDLARYEDDIVRGHRVWTPTVRKIMLTPGRFTDNTFVKYQPGNEMDYASGLAVGLRKGQFFIQHGGSAEGFKNQYERLPKVGLSVALLCNHGDWNPLDKADQIIDALQPGLLKEPTPDRLQGLYYSQELSAAYNLIPESSKLRVTIIPDSTDLKSSTFLLQKTPDNGYESGYESISPHAGIHLTPDADGDGFTIRMARTTGIHFQRIDENKPLRH